MSNRYRRATSLVEARRWQLLWLVSQKRSILEASKVIGINYDYARKIVKSYNQSGEKAVIKKEAAPRKRPNHALLNEEQLAELHVSLKGESPDKGIWTGPKVAEWIAEKTGREKVWKQRGWDYLKQCGYSRQKPRPQHQKGEKFGIIWSNSYHFSATALRIAVSNSNSSSDE